MMKLPVLIVDDDRNLLEALCTTLRLAGHTALAAGDGEAALALLQGQQVGLVVSDVQMKPMDGLQLLQKIKALNPALPMLLMTAYGEIGKAVAAMRAGACDYLLKPFENSVSLFPGNSRAVIVNLDNCRGIISGNMNKYLPLRRCIPECIGQDIL